MKLQSDQARIQTILAGVLGVVGLLGLIFSSLTVLFESTNGWLVAAMAVSALLAGYPIAVLVSLLRPSKPSRLVRGGLGISLIVVGALIAVEGARGILMPAGHSDGGTPVLLFMFVACAVLLIVLVIAIELMNRERSLNGRGDR